MKKITLLLITLFITISCSKNDEIVNAPETIKATSWYKYFDEEEVKRATGGAVNTSTINSITLTFNITDDVNFEVDSFTSTTQGGISQNHKGTYTYNSNNGVVIFNYNSISFFGKSSDRGVVNGDKMTLENTFTFKQQ